MLHWRHFQGSSGPALASSHGQNDLELCPYLSLSSFFMESKQKYDPAAFCSSEMAFWSKSQPLKQPSRAEVGIVNPVAGIVNQGCRIPQFQLGLSLPALTQLRRVNNSIKSEPQQCAYICIFSSSLSIFKEPRAVAAAPQPGWSLCWSTHSGRQQLSPGRICSEG